MAPKSFHKQKNAKDKVMNIQENKQVRQASVACSKSLWTQTFMLYVFVFEAQVLEEDKEHGPLVTVCHVL